MRENESAEAGRYRGVAGVGVKPHHLEAEI